MSDWQYYTPEYYTPIIILYSNIILQNPKYYTPEFCLRIKSYLTKNVFMTGGMQPARHS